MTSMTILTEADLREIVTLDLDAVACVENAFRALATLPVAMPPILRLDIPEHRGEVDVKTAYVPGVDGFAIKISPGFFDNPKLGLPSVNGMMVLLSARTGLVEALLLDNGYLTDIRTAAAGAVAAKYLARADASVATIFGAGVQAGLQLEALALVRPIAEARIWARDGAKAEALAGRLSDKLGIRVRAETDAARAVAGSDILVTTTPSTEPLFPAGLVEAGQHITAMGSDAEHKNEIAPGSDRHGRSLRRRQRPADAHPGRTAPCHRGGTDRGDGRCGRTRPDHRRRAAGPRHQPRHHHRRPDRDRSPGHGDRHAGPRPRPRGEGRHTIRNLKFRPVRTDPTSRT